jgi:hypothetical protein
MPLPCYLNSGSASVLCGKGVRNIITLALTEITAGDAIRKASNDWLNLTINVTFHFKFGL